MIERSRHDVPGNRNPPGVKKEGKGGGQKTERDKQREGRRKRAAVSVSSFVSI